MKKKLQRILMFLFFINLVPQISSAQVSAIPFTAALDTFSPITGTTVDTHWADDVTYQGIPIGFTFNYGGAPHDYMSLNTNGYIELDSTGTNAFYSILSGTRNNIVAPFGADLINYNPNASLQYVTIGTAPDRICIVQWLHYSYFGNSGDVSFQIWMHEGSNCIRFVYGNNSLTTNPLSTQIGLRGSNNQDFIVLGDTACNWANAYPYPAITTTFPVSLSCSMPGGFAFHFGACAGGTVDFSYLSGTIFNDLNGDGIRDTNETGIANHVVNLVPGNYYVSSDAAGNFAFFYADSSLTYTLTTGGITYWNRTTPVSLSCNPQTQSGSGLNFGFQTIPNLHEVAVNCPNWAAKPGQLEPMPINYQNNGTAIESDTITFVMDSLYSFVSSNPAPTIQNGQIIQWAYSNLAPGQHGFIMLQLMPSLNAVLGDTLYSTLSIGPLNDTVPLNNVKNLHQLISLAWDPNEKAAEPAGDIKAGDEILYTIHFQNTGNATATHVIVKDTIDNGLDLLSFRLLGSSHPVNMTMDGSRIVTFSFYNIQLPDSGSDLAGSNGFVSYALTSQSNLSPLTSIYNRAGIIFDSNVPVMTNTTVNTVRLETGINHITSTLQIGASPNPASSYVVFDFSANALETGDLSIYTITGKLWFSKTRISSSEKINLADLPSGIYICTLTTKENKFVVKVVKE
jgi:uncharacterized repeat protein (TIGR01451 family)